MPLFLKPHKDKPVYGYFLSNVGITPVNIRHTGQDETAGAWCRAAVTGTATRGARALLRRRVALRRVRRRCTRRGATTRQASTR